MNNFIDYKFSSVGDPLNLLELCIRGYEISLTTLESAFQSNIDLLSDEQLKTYDCFHWILSSLRDLKNEYESSLLDSCVISDDVNSTLTVNE